MTNPFFGNVPQQKGVAPQAAPSGTTSLTSDIDPIKRAKFTGYLQGMSANAVPPQPLQPPMMPQPPMPMNMGGMVDVFDPMYMNQGGFVISTDDSGKIRTRPVFDEDRGRMVSQILSRDMVDDMANKAAMLKTRQSPPMEVEPPPIVVEPESKLVAIKKMLEDDYESGKGFAETMQPVTTEPTISLPVQKPKIQLPVSKPEFSDIEVPVSKPNIASILKGIDDDEELRDAAEYTSVRDIDDLGTEDRMKPSDPFSYFLQSGPEGLYSKRTKPFVKPKLNVLRSLIGEEDGGIEEYDDPDELMDVASYIKDIDDLGTEERAKPTVSPEEMETIARMITEGEKRSGPDVDVFDMLNISPMGETYGEEMGEAQTGTVGIYPETPKKDLTIDDIARLILASQTEPLISSGERKDSNRIVDFLNRFVLGKRAQIGMNDGGIVQAFRRGGDVYAEKEKYRDKSFSSNISGNVGGRDDRDSDDLGSATPIFQERDSDDLGSATPVFKYPEFDAGERAAGYMLPQKEPIVDADIAFGGSGKEEDDVFSTPYADAGFAKAEANPLNKYVAPVTNFIAGLQTNPNTGQKFDMSNTSDRYDYYNLTQQTKDASDRAAEARRRDQDRAAAKLAEEQRLRDMIAGMMPKTAATPAPPMVTAPDAPTATPATPDYSSVVVPSDRVPGFDVGNISPFPQFRMPTEFTPVFPESLSNSYFRDLFKNIGVNKMQEGGAVNQLDSAIDNFINAYR